MANYKYPMTYDYQRSTDRRDDPDETEGRAIARAEAEMIARFQMNLARVRLLQPKK